MIIHGLIEIEKFTLGVMLIFSHKSVSFAPRLQTNIYLTFVINADVAKLADAPDLGSGGQPWGFKSPLSHHIKTVQH